MVHSFLSILTLFLAAFLHVAAAKSASVRGIGRPGTNGTVTSSARVKRPGRGFQSSTQGTITDSPSTTSYSASTDNDTTVYWTSTIYITLTSSTEMPSTDASSTETPGGLETGTAITPATHGPWLNTTTPSVDAVDASASQTASQPSQAVNLKDAGSSTVEITTTVTSTTTLTVTATTTDTLTALATHYATLTQSCLPGSTPALLQSTFSTPR